MSSHLSLTLVDVKLVIIKSLFSKLNSYKLKSWNHICIYGSRLNPLFGVSINGEHLYKEDEFPTEEFRGSLHLMHNGKLSGYVTFGQFTDLNIWSSVLNPKEIKDMSKSLTIWTDPFLKWSDVKIDLLNFEEEDILEEEDLLCNIPENLFVFKMKTFNRAISVCESIGGEIATPKENTMIESWKNITTRDNLGRIYLSYSDQIKGNDFRNIYTGEHCQALVQ